MKIKLPNRRRVLRWIVILALIVLVLVYIVMPIGFGIAAVFPYKESVGAAPEGYSEVTLTTEDGVELAAWYRPPTNDAVIILLHGAGGSRERVRGYAAMLERHGYGVLAVDLRGHGESEGRTNRFAWRGTPDVGAAVAFLNGREEVTAIGALGLSMGGEVVLGAASEYPEMRAVVADGATHRSLDEVRALESERAFHRYYVRGVVYLTVQVLTGEEPPKPLLDSMVETQATRFLLIAAGNDDSEIAYNELFAETVGERVTLWIAPDTSHTGAFKKYPDEYEQRVIAFLDAALLGDSEE